MRGLTAAWANDAIWAVVALASALAAIGFAVYEQMLSLQLGLLVSTSCVALFALLARRHFGVGVASEAEAENVRLRLLVVDRTSDIVLFSRRDGTIVWANHAAQAAYGFSQEMLTGRTIYDLCRGDCPPLSESDGELAQQTFDTTHVRADGTTFPVEVNRSALREHETTVLTLVRDVSDRRRHAAARAIIREFDARILRGQPLESVLRYVVEEVARLHDFAVVQIGLKGVDGAIEVHAWAGREAGFVSALRVRWDDTPEGCGPTGTAIRTGRPVYVADIASDPGFAPWRQKAQAHGLRAGLALPLIAGEAVLGSLTVYVTDPRGLNREAREDLEAFADQVELCLAAAHAHEQIRLQMAALEATANAVLIADREGVVRWVNPAFTQLTGWSADEILGKTPRVLKSGAHAEAFYRVLWTTVLHGDVWRGEVYNRRKDGSIYAEEQTITPVRDIAGAISHFVAIKQDVSERKRQEERIRHLALHDLLTDLPNRRALQEDLVRVTERARRGHVSALVLVDIDHFKLVNDSVGHAAGDRLLVSVAELLKRALRPGDRLARLGGDEFALVLERVTLEQARSAVERLLQAIEQSRFQVQEHAFSLSLSVGLCPIDGSLAPEAVMALADSALYAAKGQGGNRLVLLHEPDEASLALAHAGHWAGRIKDALRDGRFVLHYQPVVRLSDRTHDRLEALIRLVGEAGSLVYPEAFLGAAERFGLMAQVDRWVLEQILDALRVSPGLRVFMNLSGLSLGDESTLTHIERRVAESGLAPGQLAFEITETVAVSDLVSAQAWIHRLKDLGCLFALDDFGAGFASFSYLRELPVDYVKVDGALVRNIDRDVTDRALVQAISSVAHALGKEVIGEAVESEQVARTLQDLGIAFGQGFHLGRPGSGF